MQLGPITVAAQQPGDYWVKEVSSLWFMGGGRRRIRTFVGVTQQIYSLLVIAFIVTHLGFVVLMLAFCAYVCEFKGTDAVVFGRLSARRIFSDPGRSTGSVLFFCDCRHLSVTRP
jgi:hypothetical protein